MKQSGYHFDGFHLVPATRELRKDGQLVNAQRMVFDCLAYLLEHRSRAIGRDELMSALWGRVDVPYAQVSHLVRRARQAVGDASGEQKVIRTVPDFGYRWVADVQVTQEEDSAEPVPPRAEADRLPALDRSGTGSVAASPGKALAPAAEVSTSLPADVAAPASRRLRAWHRVGPVVLLLSTIVAVATYLALAHRRAPPTASALPSAAIVVLPLEVVAPGDAGWVRLGAMDLIAGRLRGAGLPVPSSDSVVAALHAVGEPIDAEHRVALGRVLGVARLVEGKATRSPAGWKVELSSAGDDGLFSRAEVERPDVTEAARHAADLLLAAMGHSVAGPLADEHDGDSLREILPRAQAALLADQLDAARAILSDVPEPARADPRRRILLAQVELRAGKLDLAQSMLVALLDAPATASHPSLRAEILSSLGFIGLTRNDCVEAEHRFDDAVAAVGSRRTGLDVGAALSARGAARACLRRFGEAVADLSEAGPILSAAGDRLGLARLDNHFGVLEFYRHRPAEAVPYLERAATVHESFGTVESFAADQALLVTVQVELLRWPDALASSERLWNLHGHIGDPARVRAMAGVRAMVLVRTGRQAEADALLRSAGSEKSPPDAALDLAFHQAEAELAWTKGDATQTLAALARAWAALPPAQMRDEEDIRTLLLGQRAAIASGHPAPALHPGTGLPATEGGDSPIPLVAVAEWADHEGRPADAERAFREAGALAEARGVPSTTVLVVDAYVRWLLARQRSAEARAIAGRVLPWADRDFDSALLLARTYRAGGDVAAAERAREQARQLAGEREVDRDAVPVQITDPAR